MAKPKSGLGRGLGELLQRTDAQTGEILPITDAEFRLLPIDSIKPNPKQPRVEFDEDQLVELSESITEVGFLQPIVVRQVGPGYELIMGERRLRAGKLAGLEKIPAIVRFTEEENLLRDALLENLHRAQLNPLEEAAAYQQMLEDFGCTQEELSRRIKRSRPQIANTIRLLKLPAAVQRRVAAGVLSAGHARALLSLDDSVAMEKLAQKIVAEGLSVRSTEESISLGDVSRETPKRQSSPRAQDVRAIAIENDLTDALDTKVRVTIGRNKGRIVIEFGDEDDLDRVLVALRQYR